MGELALASSTRSHSTVACSTLVKIWSSDIHLLTVEECLVVLLYFFSSRKQGDICLVVVNILISYPGAMVAGLC